ncbi:MAG: hypothetical protein ACI4N4_03860 [Candidatus Fimenecus sp.]
MSKTKKIKQKTTGFDIFYRVITVIMTVAMYPLFYFKNILYFQIDHTSISNLINKITGEDTLQVTYDYISISGLPDWINMIKSYMGESTDLGQNIFSNSLYRPVIVAVAFIAITLILGLVIIGFALFSNKVKVITALSGSGLLCAIASYISFTAFFANPLINGDITLAQLFNVQSTVVNLILGAAGQVTVFRLEGAFFAVLFLMLGIFVWSAAVLIVNASEGKEKPAQKKAKN